MDILAPANNIALGDGWLPLEIYGDEKFRWVSNSAEIYVAAFRNVRHYLQIYVEAGISLDLKPFELLVTEMENTLARTVVKGRQMISVELPPSEPMIRRLVLRAEGSGIPDSKDGRVLNLRVFKLNFVQATVDILPPGSSARPGSGWYPLETFNGETFRWAANDAQIEIPEKSNVKHLLLEVEPGPGVGSKPFILRVLEASGAQIAEIEVRTRQTVSIPIGKAEEEGPVSVTLRAEGGGTQIGSDHRIMNFRAFQHSFYLRTPLGQSPQP